MNSKLSRKIYQDTYDLKRRPSKITPEIQSICNKIFSSDHVPSSHLPNLVNHLVSYLKENFPEVEVGYWVNWPRVSRWSKEEVMISLDEISNGEVLWFSSGKGVNWDLVKVLVEKYQVLKIGTVVEELPIENETFVQFLESLPWACVVFESNGEFLSKNKKFSDLIKNIPEFLFYAQKNEVIQINELYQINEVKSLSLTMFFLIPLTAEKTPAKDLISEAGIVCSSLAHELNNPLMGMLLTLELLEMEKQDPEFLKQISEIKKNTIRSIDLVKIFLGFSRLDKTQGAECNWKELSQTALDLLRPRFIEGTLGLVLEWVEGSEVIRRGNSSYVAMIFFIIFDEILTQLSHFQMLAGRQNGAIWPIVQIKIEKNEMFLKFELNKINYRTLENNSLLNFVLHSLEIELDVRAGEIRLKFKDGIEDIFGTPDFFPKNQLAIDASH